MLKLLKVLRFLFDSSLTENQTCYSKNESFFFFKEINHPCFSFKVWGHSQSFLCVLRERYFILKRKNKIVLISFIRCHGRQAITRKKFLFHISLGHFSAITPMLKFFLELIQNLIFWCCIWGKCYLKKCFSYAI